VSDEEKVYTVAEVAQRLGVSRSTVYEEIDARRLKARRHGKKGGTIRITAAQLHAYEQLCETQEQPCQSESSRTAVGKPTCPTNVEVSRGLNGLLTPKSRPKTGKRPSEPKPTIVSLGAENDAYSGKH
jgi:excisionase family DNA binding protein